MTKILAASAAIAILAFAASAANAQTCSPTALPYTASNGLANGFTADASQVLADVQCPIYGLANYAGNVGIGTTSPTSTLTINGIAAPQLNIEGPPTSNSYLSLYPAGSGTHQWMVGAAGTSNGWGTGKFIIYDATAALPRIIIDTSGNVGVGTTTPREQLDVNGNMIVGRDLMFPDIYGNTSFFVSQGDGNFVFYNTDSSGNYSPSFYQYQHQTGSTFVFISPVAIPSDGRLKTNIQPVVGGLSLITQMVPVRYNWISTNQRVVAKNLALDTNQTQIGFVAQDLQKILPEAVISPKNANDIYTMKPDVIIPILVEAVKEQQVEIQQLQTQIAASKNTN